MDTIVAIATPPGRGGVGIIRLSGPRAYELGLKISARNQLTPRFAHYGAFYDLTGELIDEGILLYFKAPHSFTGEDIIEIQCHGSPIVLDQLIQQCLVHGARVAKPGEFTERAFLNDKIDLTQAEAIADLIQASSLTAARMAIKSLQGIFSQKIDHLNQQMIQLRLYVEAAIDFPEEEIDFLNDGKIAAKLSDILADLLALEQSATQGVIIREGLSVVIAGRPNAGKSTLINQLAGRDVAIVTELAGTTRDVIREHIVLDDIPMHIIDTAGLRECHDVVEQEGVKRAWHELGLADCVLLVIDANVDEHDAELDDSIAAKLPAQVPVIRIYNKADTLKNPLTHLLSKHDVLISAKSGKGIPSLINKIKEVVGFQPTEGQFLARRRHIEALNQAKNLILSGQSQLKTHRAGELLAEDLRLAHQVLSEVTGEFTSEDLLGEIFSNFCIGK